MDVKHEHSSHELILVSCTYSQYHHIILIESISKYVVTRILHVYVLRSVYEVLVVVKNMVSIVVARLTGLVIIKL